MGRFVYGIRSLKAKSEHQYACWSQTKTIQFMLLIFLKPETMPIARRSHQYAWEEGMKVGSLECQHPFTTFEHNHLHCKRKSGG